MHTIINNNSIWFTILITRIIHITLRNHPQVTTQSVGEGEQRKVTIIPRS